MSSLTTAVERYQPVMSEAEQTTLLGFLAGYRGYTRDAYTLDLRQFTAWCWQRQHRLFEVRRVDIECFARDLEDRGKARATVARRLCTIVGFYRYAEEEGVIEHSPAVHIRRPRIDYESHVAHLDRNEFGSILVTAGLSSPRDHALVSLLALNGLRVSEAIGANIEALGSGARPSHPDRVAQGRQAGDDAARPTCCPGSRFGCRGTVEGPIFLDPTVNGSIGMLRGGSCAGSLAVPGSASGSDRTRCVTLSSPPPWTPVSRCVTCRKRPVTPTHERRCATTVAANRWTVTPPISSPRSSPALPADNQHSGVRCRARARTGRRNTTTNKNRTPTRPDNGSVNRSRRARPRIVRDMLPTGHSVCEVGRLSARVAAMPDFARFSCGVGAGRNAALDDVTKVTAQSFSGSVDKGPTMAVRPS